MVTEDRHVFAKIEITDTLWRVALLYFGHPTAYRTWQHLLKILFGCGFLWHGLFSLGIGKRGHCTTFGTLV